LTLANEAVARELSVRELERRVRELHQAPSQGGRSQVAPRSTTATNPPVVRRMEDELRKRLQTDVKIRLSGSERGAIEISFYSADDLERVLDVVLGGQREHA
jgi:ParB family chromosome partitioning protein